MKPGAVRAGLVVLAALFGLAACSDDGYQRRQGRWHHGDQPVAGADDASFRPLEHGFARDAHQGYCLGVVVAGSHGPSFEVLAVHEARDRATVWWVDTERRASEYWAIRRVRAVPLDGADAERYRSLGQGYGSDGHRVWFEGRALAVADAATFEPMAGGFARDARQGYFDQQAIPGSRGDRLQLVDPNDPSHVQDDRHVYSAHIDLMLQPPRAVIRTLPQAVPGQVHLPGRGYARDGQRVWYRGLPVDGADAPHFGLVDGAPDDADASDGRHRYRQGRRLD